MIKITVETSVPSLNQIWRFGNNVRKKHKKWEKDFGLLFRSAIGTSRDFPLKEPCCIYIDWLSPKHNGDLDNKAKIILDALKGIAFEDDKQVVRLQMSKTVSDFEGVSVYVGLVPYKSHVFKGWNRIVSFEMEHIPSANRYWRKGRYGVYNAQKIFKERFRKSLQHLKREKRDGKIGIRLNQYGGNGDLDNRLKTIVDAMEGIFYDDDKQIVLIDAIKFPSSSAGKFLIEVYERY